MSSLQAADDHDTESNRIDCHRSTAGTVVQSLHKLKDVDGSGKKKKFNTAAPPLASAFTCKNANIMCDIYLDAGFFIFPDISVRVEGFFRLRFTLFEITG